MALSPQSSSDVVVVVTEGKYNVLSISCVLNRVPSLSHACLTSVAASSLVVFCVRSLSITRIVQSSVINEKTLGEFRSSRTLASTLERQTLDSCCSDADRICSIVASIKGRAKLGLQASSRLSKRIRRLNLGRRLVIVVKEVVEVEIVKGAVVVTNQMIKVKIEVVGDREDPVFKELTICLSGFRSVEVAPEIMLSSMVAVQI